MARLRIGIGYAAFAVQFLMLLGAPGTARAQHRNTLRANLVAESRTLEIQQ